jgi:calcineurin-like phosphoesterase family protein
MMTPHFDEILRDLAPSLDGVLFYGDPHSKWWPLLDAVADNAPHSVIILGDLIENKNDDQAFDDTRAALNSMLDAGIDVRIISGNHDVDSDAVYDLIFHEFGHLIFDGEIITVGPRNLRIAGLGGVFKGKVWYPQTVDDAAYYSPDELLADTPKSSRFRGGIPRKQRVAIFPSVVDHLSQQSADILVTHEAPSTHASGFSVIDDLAISMGSKLTVYGHHHTVAETCLSAQPIAVRGMGQAEVWNPESEEIRGLILFPEFHALNMKGFLYELDQRHPFQRYRYRYPAIAA